MKCCPLEGCDFELGPVFSRVEVRRAAKPWLCCECNAGISIGHGYEYAVGKWDRSLAWFHTCVVCMEIRDHFACDGFTYGELKPSIHGPPARMSGKKLRSRSCQSPAAKDMLFTRCLEWREREGARHERFG